MLSFPLTLLRLSPVSLSFLTSAEYPPMPMSGCLRGQLISSASYYEYLWLPSSSVCFSSTISLGSSPVSPRIRRRSSSHSVLVGEELKHIRPALELRLHCKWESRGERENSPWHWRVLVNPWKAPRTSKLSLNITTTLSVSLLSGRLPNGERRTLLWENTTALAIVSHSDRTAATTIEIIPEETKPIISPRGQRTAIV